MGGSENFFCVGRRWLPRKRVVAPIIGSKMGQMSGDRRLGTLRASPPAQAHPPRQMFVKYLWQ